MKKGGLPSPESWPDILENPTISLLPYIPT
jgi:hypothetical protein